MQYASYDLKDVYLYIIWVSYPLIRLAQLVERQSHELVVVGSSPTSDILCMVGSIQLPG